MIALIVALSLAAPAFAQKEDRSIARCGRKNGRRNPPEGASSAMAEFGELAP